MKKTGSILLLGAVLALFGTAAFAADTATINVSATVVGSCKFNTASYNMAFGNLDPAIGTNQSRTVTASYWCSVGVTPITLAANDGANSVAAGARRMTDGTNFLPYSLALAAPTSATGLGSATAITADITGTVLGTDYIPAVPGVYADTVQLTITP